jgi:hypothetical protein
MGERFSPGFSVSTEDQESLTSRLSPLAKHSWQLSLRLGGVHAAPRLCSPEAEVSSGPKSPDTCRDTAPKPAARTRPF